jgi:hypothetical protein
MACRTTVKLSDVLTRVNKWNRESMSPRASRDGWNSLLEMLLHDANVYAGFGYLTQDEVPAMEEPGIIRGDEGNVFPDESRRFYYVHRKLA